MKKALVILMMLILAIGLFSGCNMTEIDKEELGTKVLAEVNGEEILRKDWSPLYESYRDLYIQYYSIDPTTTSGQKTLKTLKDNILESIIASKIWEQKARAAGFYDFTEEQKAEARKKVEDEINKKVEENAQTMYDAVKGQEGAKELDYYIEQARIAYERDMEKNGETVESRVQAQLEEDALDLFREDVLKDIVPVEADIITKYAELKKSQNESYGAEQDYAAFVSTYNSGNDPIVVKLDGYRLVQHILIKFTADDSTAVSNASKEKTTAETNLKNLQDELKKLEEAEEPDQEAITQKQQEVSEAETALQEKTSAYEKAFADAKAAIQEEADAVLASVQGADEAKFIEVMIDKTEDSMNTEEAAKKGYLVGNEDGMATEFHDAAMALENDGDISGLVATQYGYHIIRKMCDLKAGEADMEEVREAITEELTETQQNEKWESLQTEWRNSAKVSIKKQWMKDYDYDF